MDRKGRLYPEQGKKQVAFFRPLAQCHENQEKILQTTILAVVGMLMIVTALYKLLPYRVAGTKKPFLALLPKYKKRVKHSLTRAQLEEMLAEFGFEKVGGDKSLMKFSRGFVLGDFSIKLAKINVGLKTIADNEHEITVQAGWVAAFDTGDHWQLIAELGERIENA